MRYRYLILCVVLFQFLFADEEETHDISFGELPRPWFTGPLLAPSGFTVGPGHLVLQPFFDQFVNVGMYNSNWKSESIPNFYNIQLRIRLKTGILRWMDVQVFPEMNAKLTGNAKTVGFADLPVTINFQLLAMGLKDPWPSIKLVFTTFVPCGKYQELRPSLHLTDANGTGSWYPEVGAVFSKLWHLSGIHYLEARLFSAYRIGTPASVKGLSVYGGDRTTRGVAYPGDIFLTDASIEYNFTQNWGFACDFNYQHRNRSRFSGKTEIDATLPSSERFSIAPALEYNFSENLGIIGGLWCSIIGRNTPQFFNGMLSLNAYF